MKDATSAILVERAQSAGDLRRATVVSSAAHVVLVALVVFVPGSWFSSAEEDAALDVMTLRLGGPEGPGEGGLTPLGSRPIQEVVPLQEARRPQWIQPPSPAPPEMILPVTEEESRRRPEPETEVETAPEEARGRTPTRGPEAREGLAMADTGVTGLGIGLSAGGLGGTASELDVGDFCCPQYLTTMLELIRQHWDNRQRVPGRVVVRFTIERSGAIEGVAVARTSGYLALDQSARRAVLLTRTLPRLPSRFPEENLIVRLTFNYQL